MSFLWMIFRLTSSVSWDKYSRWHMRLLTCTDERAYDTPIHLLRQADESSLTHPRSRKRGHPYQKTEFHEIVSKTAFTSVTGLQTVVNQWETVKDRHFHPPSHPSPKNHDRKHRFILHKTAFYPHNPSFYQSELRHKNLLKRCNRENAYQTVKDVNDGETAYPSPLQAEYKQVITPWQMWR